MQTLFRLKRALGSILSVGAALVLFAGPAFSQGAQTDLLNRFTRLEQELQRLRAQIPGAANAPAPARPNDAETDLNVRLLALERAIEQLTGLVEESRFKTDRMSGQLQVLTDDLSLRMATVEQSLGITPAPPQQRQVSAPPGVQRPAPAEPGLNLDPDAPLSAPVTPVRPPVAPPPVQPVQPAAAAGDGGVNQAGQFVVRTDAQGRPLAADPNAAPPPPEAQPTGPAPALKAAPAGAAPATSQLALNSPTDVRLPDGSPKLQYEYAFEFLKRNDYGRAEVALRDFLKRHAKDPLAGNAQYWLGETFYVRGDYQQAAVEFMAGYQQYPKTVKGPDNLLKLGVSLSKLSQTQGACTALGRINKDYPDAPDAILKSAGAERTKLKCK